MESKERRFPARTAAAALAALLCLAYYFRDALVPFALSLALAYLVNPAVSFFEAKGLRRDRVVFGMYLAVLIAIYFSASFLLPRISEEVALLQNQAPAYFVRGKAQLGHFQVQFAQHLPVGRDLAERWTMGMIAPLLEQFERLPRLLLGLFPLISLIFLAPFITFFLLIDSPGAIRAIVQNCPSRWVEQALHIATEIDTSMGNYMRGLVMEVIAVAALSLIGLYFLGVDYALAISALSGILTFIPYAGAVAGGLAACTVALFQFQSAAAVLKVAGLFAGIRLGDDLILQPILSKYSVHLHPVAYLLALILGGEAFGFIGLIFAIPAACLLKVLLKVAWDWYASEVLMQHDTPAEARLPYV